jgi:hypothetical protein
MRGKSYLYLQECVYNVIDIKTNLQDSVILCLFISFMSELQYTVKLQDTDLLPTIHFQLLPNADFIFKKQINGRKILL